MTASEAMGRVRRDGRSYFLDLRDGSIEFRHSSYPGGPEHERGQHFGTSYLWVRMVHPSGLVSHWARSGSRSLAGAVMDAIRSESATAFLDGLYAEG